MSTMCEECRCTVFGNEACGNGCGCCGGGPNTVIWKSVVTKEMVEGWSDDEIEMLVTDLDDAVMATLQDYEGHDH